MDCDELMFTSHALARMFERSILPDDVRQVIVEGEQIAEYRDDRPYPSYLLLGTVAGRVIHVVVARDMAARRCHVITVYLPDALLWDNEFKRRQRR
jgi:hypothetical protein